MPARRVAVAGFGDDAEHDAQGASQLPLLLHEHSEGSLLYRGGTLLGAFATDSRIGMRSQQGFTDHAVPVSGYDVWTGLLRNQMLPCCLPDTVEKLRGKRGSFRNRHELASAEPMAIPQAPHTRKPELGRGSHGGATSCSRVHQLCAPCGLHRFDAALQQLCEQQPNVLGGGVQFLSAVETLVSAVVAELLRLLTSTSLAEQMARDELCQRAGTGASGASPRYHRATPPILGGLAWTTQSVVF